MSRATFRSFCLLATVVISAGPAGNAVAAPPEKVTGTYDLDFLYSGELVLAAHIEDDQQNPATDGVVVFQYCSYLGQPRNDVTQPDEAPSGACADGTAHWVNLRARVPVTTEGDALLNFGTVSVVDVIGFRYKYSHGSEIANAITEPEDWVR